MITKLLFAAGLIGLIFLGIKSRLRPAEPPPRIINAPAARISRARLPRVAAWGLIGLMMLISSVILFFEWREGYRIVTLRVINTNTGSSRSYQAHKNDVDDRRFETLDGRIVTLANVERLEMGGDPP